MSNVNNVMCTSDTINKLITAAKKENKIFSTYDNKEVMHVVFGFDYILEYGYDPTRFLRTNLSNWDHIIFIVPNGSNNALIKVKLITFEDDPDSINFNDEPNIEKRELLNDK